MGGRDAATEKYNLLDYERARATQIRDGENERRKRSWRERESGVVRQTETSLKRDSRDGEEGERRRETNRTKQDGTERKIKAERNKRRRTRVQASRTYLNFDSTFAVRFLIRSIQLVGGSTVSIYTLLSFPGIIPLVYTIFLHAPRLPPPAAPPLLLP